MSIRAIEYEGNVIGHVIHSRTPLNEVFREEIWEARTPDNRRVLTTTYAAAVSWLMEQHAKEENQWMAICATQSF